MCRVQLYSAKEFLRPLGLQYSTWAREGFAFSVLFYNHALVLGPTTELPTDETLIDIMKEVEIGAMIVISSMLETMYKCQRQDFVDIPKPCNMCSGLEVRQLTFLVFCSQIRTALICFHCMAIGTIR